MPLIKQLYMSVRSELNTDVNISKSKNKSEKQKHQKYENKREEIKGAHHFRMILEVKMFLFREAF